MFIFKQATKQFEPKVFPNPLPVLVFFYLTLVSSMANAALVSYNYSGSAYNFLNPAASNPYDGLHLTISIVHEELGPSFSGSLEESYVSLSIYDGIRTANFVETALDVTTVDDFWINQLYLVTDATGAIENWYISLSTDGINSLISSVYGGGSTAQDSIRLPGWSPLCPTITGPCYAVTDYGGIDEPAIPSWTVSAAPVPVPAAAWLFGSALAGLAGLGFKRK